MYEEMRLHSLGCPLEDAVTLCNCLRKDGTLKNFVEKLEQEYREQFAHEINMHEESE